PRRLVIHPGERVDEARELPSPRRQPVLGAGRPRIDEPAFEQARLRELREAGREGPRRHRPERLAELVEPLGAREGRVEDGERPAPLEEVRRPADLLGNRAAPTAAGHRSSATVRLPNLVTQCYKPWAHAPRRATEVLVTLCYLVGLAPAPTCRLRDSAGRPVRPPARRQPAGPARARARAPRRGSSPGGSGSPRAPRRGRPRGRRGSAPG